MNNEKNERAVDEALATAAEHLAGLEHLHQVEYMRLVLQNTGDLCGIA